MKKILACIAAVLSVALSIGMKTHSQKIRTENEESTTAETTTGTETTVSSAAVTALPLPDTTSMVISAVSEEGTSFFGSSTASIWSDPFFTGSATTVTAAAKVLADYFRGYILTADGKVARFSDGTKRVSVPDLEMCTNNLLSEKSAMKLDTRFESTLRNPNPHPEAKASTGNPLGISIMLTIDSSIQKRFFDYLEAHDLRGCAILADGSGAIEAAASYPSFSESVTVASGSTSFYNTAFRPIPLGSVTKITSGVALAYSGFLNLETDPGRDEQLSITNWDYSTKANAYPRKNVSLYDATVNSWNMFFGKGFASVGAAKIQTPLDMFFKYSDPIECDFGTLTRTADLNDTMKRAHAGYGQRCREAPIQLAFEALAVCSGKGMVQPYMLQKTIDSYTKEVIEDLHPEPQYITPAIPDEYTKETCRAMKQIAKDISLTLDKYDLYAKTGTAASEGLFPDDIMSTVVVLQNSEGEQKAFMLTVTNGNSQHGARYASDLKEHVQALLDLIEQP